MNCGCIPFRIFIPHENFSDYSMRSFNLQFSVAFRKVEWKTQPRNIYLPIFTFLQHSWWYLCRHFSNWITKVCRHVNLWRVVRIYSRTLLHFCNFMLCCGAYVKLSQLDFRKLNMFCLLPPPKTSQKNSFHVYRVCIKSWLPQVYLRWLKTTLFFLKQKVHFFYNRIMASVPKSTNRLYVFKSNRSLPKNFVWSSGSPNIWKYERF